MYDGQSMKLVADELRSFILSEGGELSASNIQQFYDASPSMKTILEICGNPKVSDICDEFPHLLSYERLPGGGAMIVAVTDENKGLPPLPPTGELSEVWGTSNEVSIRLTAYCLVHWMHGTKCHPLQGTHCSMFFEDFPALPPYEGKDICLDSPDLLRWSNGCIELVDPHHNAKEQKDRIVAMCMEWWLSHSRHSSGSAEGSQISQFFEDFQAFPVTKIPALCQAHPDLLVWHAGGAGKVSRATTSLHMRHRAAIAERAISISSASSPSSPAAAAAAAARSITTSAPVRAAAAATATTTATTNTAAPTSTTTSNSNSSSSRPASSPPPPAAAPAASYAGFSEVFGKSKKLPIRLTAHCLAHWMQKTNHKFLSGARVEIFRTDFCCLPPYEIEDLCKDSPDLLRLNSSQQAELVNGSGENKGHKDRIAAMCLHWWLCRRPHGMVEGPELLMFSMDFPFFESVKVQKLCEDHPDLVRWDPAGSGRVTAAPGSMSEVERHQKTLASTINGKATVTTTLHDEEVRLVGICLSHWMMNENMDTMEGTGLGLFFDEFPGLPRMKAKVICEGSPLDFDWVPGGSGVIAIAPSKSRVREDWVIAECLSYFLRDNIGGMAGTNISEFFNEFPYFPKVKAPQLCDANPDILRWVSGGSGRIERVRPVPGGGGGGGGAAKKPNNVEQLRAEAQANAEKKAAAEAKAAASAKQAAKASTSDDKNRLTAEMLFDWVQVRGGSITGTGLPDFFKQHPRLPAVKGPKLCEDNPDILRFVYDKGSGKIEAVVPKGKGKGKGAKGKAAPVIEKGKSPAAAAKAAGKAAGKLGKDAASKGGKDPWSEADPWGGKGQPPAPKGGKEAGVGKGGKDPWMESDPWGGSGQPAKAPSKSPSPANGETSSDPWMKSDPWGGSGNPPSKGSSAPAESTTEALTAAADALAKFIRRQGGSLKMVDMDDFERREPWFKQSLNGMRVSELCSKFPSKLELSSDGIVTIFSPPRGMATSSSSHPSKPPAAQEVDPLMKDDPWASKLKPQSEDARNYSSYSSSNNNNNTYSGYSSNNNNYSSYSTTAETSSTHDASAAASSPPAGAGASWEGSYRNGWQDWGQQEQDKRDWYDSQNQEAPSQQAQRRPLLDLELAQSLSDEALSEASKILLAEMTYRFTKRLGGASAPSAAGPSDGGQGGDGWE